MPPQSPKSDDMPLFPNLPATELVHAETGEPVSADADPSTPVARADVDPLGPRRILKESVTLGHLVVEGGFLGDSPPGVVTTVAGDVVAIDEIGSATTLRRSNQD